jgi:hypothetical protein
MNDLHATNFVEYQPSEPTSSVQEALERGERCYEMLVKILDVLKTEVGHRGAGSAMSPNDLLYKIIGLAHEYNLPDIREKALAYQESRGE